MRRLLGVVLVAVTMASAGLPAQAAKPRGGGTTTTSNVSATLEAYDRVSASWTRGNVAGYAELEKIPYRLILSSAAGATVNSVETIYDHTDNRGVPGIEDLKDFMICGLPLTSGPPGGTGCVPVPVVAPDGTPPASGPYVQGPYCTTTDPTVCTYVWHNIVIPAGGTVVLTWGALLARGSHAYNGASLHMRLGDAVVNGAPTSLGNKDVPIPVKQIIATEVDKTINGSDGPVSVKVGDIVTVTITAKTFGPPKGTQTITIVDNMPACLEYVAGSATPTPTSTSPLTWTFTNVPNGTTKTVTFQAKAVTPGECENVAILTSDKAPPDEDTVVVVISGVPSLSISKVCPTSASPGATAQHTLNFSNTGTEDAAGVKVVDVLGNGLIYVGNAKLNGASITPGVQNNTPATGQTTVTFTVGTLTVGESGTITYDVRYPATFTAGTQSFTDTATISSTTAGAISDSDSCTTQVTYTPDLVITKACPATAVVGTEVTHTLTYRNAGTATATGVTITDTLPAGQTYKVGSATPEPTSASGNTVVWNIGTLAPSATSSTITYKVTLTAAGPQENTVVIASGNGDSDTSNNTAKCTTGGLVVDVYVTKACPATAQPGGTVTHTLTFGNQGNTPAADVTITDVLDPGLTYQPNTARRDGSPITPGVATNTPSAGKTTLTFSLGTLAAGSTGTITYEVKVPATASTAGPQTFRDQATIATSSAEAAGDAANNTSQACPTTVTYQPALDVSKSTCPASAVPGGFLTYTIAYSNTGSAPAAGTVLVDTIPTGSEVADDGDGTTSPDGRSVTWTLGTLAVGATGSKTFTVQVTAANGATLVNNVTLTSGSYQDSFSTSTPVSNAGAATSGSAYGLDARAVGLTLVDKVGYVESRAPGSPNAQANSVLSLAVPGVLSAGVINTASDSEVTNGSATTTAYANTADVNLLAGAITATAVHGVSQSTAGPFGASYNSTGSSFVDLKVNGVPYVNVAPNTEVFVPGLLGGNLARVVLYEDSGTSASGTLNTASHFVNMIRVTLLQPFLTLPAGAEIIVSHAESTATYPSGLPCGATPATVSGRAFTAKAVVVGGTVNTQVGDAVLPPTGGSDSDGSSANVPGVVTTSTATNTTSGSLTPNPNATSRSHVAGANVLGGLVTADVLNVSSTSAANGTTAGTTYTAEFVNLRVAGVPVTAAIGPNTTIAVPQPGGGLLLVILNEQVTNTNGTTDTDGTINAVRVLLFKAGSLHTEVIVASAHSDAHRP